ncbi:MAG: hypothetical protein JWP37_2724 [Mucilaginibacter sp.]|nr:hypothetical protein [Mucilaginibacter sp.]
MFSSNSDNYDRGHDRDDHLNDDRDVGGTQLSNLK